MFKIYSLLFSLLVWGNSWDHCASSRCKASPQRRRSPTWWCQRTWRTCLDKFLPVDLGRIFFFFLLALLEDPYQTSDFELNSLLLSTWDRHPFLLKVTENIYDPYWLAQNTKTMGGGGGCRRKNNLLLRPKKGVKMVLKCTKKSHENPKVLGGGVSVSEALLELFY